MFHFDVHSTEILHFQRPIIFNVNKITSHNVPKPFNHRPTQPETMSTATETTEITNFYHINGENTMSAFEGTAVAIDTPSKDGIVPDANDDTSPPNSIPNGQYIELCYVSFAFNHLLCYPLIGPISNTTLPHIP